MRRALLGLGLVGALMASSGAVGSEARIDKLQVPTDIEPQVRELMLGLYGGDSEKLSRAANGLARLGSKASVAAPFLVTMLYGRIGAAGAASHALSCIGKPSLEPLQVAARAGESHYIVTASLNLLGELRDESSTEVLAHMYARSGNGHAGEVLQRLGQPAVERLLPILRDPDPEERSQAAKALGVFFTPQVVQALAEALKDEDARTRIAALEGLTHIVHESRGTVTPAPAALRPALRDADADVRALALSLVTKLCLLGRNEHFELVGDALAGADRAGQLSAVEALTPLAVKGAAPEAEKLLGEQLLPVVRASFTDVDARLRCKAVLLCPRLGQRSLVPLLVKALKDDDNIVREKAIAALSAMKAVEAASALTEMLSDKDAFVRKAAAETLGALGDKQAIEALKPLLADEYEEVRNAAKAALARLGAAVPKPAP